MSKYVEFMTELPALPGLPGAGGRAAWTIPRTLGGERPLQTLRICCKVEHWHQGSSAVTNRSARRLHRSSVAEYSFTATTRRSPADKVTTKVSHAGVPVPLHRESQVIGGLEGPLQQILGLSLSQECGSRDLGSGAPGPPTDAGALRWDRAHED